MKNLMTIFGWVVLGGMLALSLGPVAATAQEAATGAPPATKMCGDQAHCLAPGARAGCPLNPHCARLVRCLVSILALIHVMLAVWVYTDIRKRGEGHGIFIVLALLGGLPATILYALVRIGDKKA